MKLILLPVLFALLICSCSENYTPKPRGYFRIDFPAKDYRPFDTPACPFAFEYPVYATMNPDSDYNTEPCWYNLDFPGYHARLHLSYKPVKGNLYELSEETRKLAMKHTTRAEGINEKYFATPGSVYGVFYEIEGNAASARQFFLTDSARHFIRGSLYFYTSPNSDSLAPVVEFISRDIDRMINSFRWKARKT